MVGGTGGTWPMVLLTVMLLLPEAPHPAGAAESKYSGVVVAVNQRAGTVVVEGMGPWRVKDGVTQPERRAIAVTPSTGSFGSSAPAAPLRADGPETMWRPRCPPGE